MRARAAAIVALLACAGCAVPRKAGFDDVARQLAPRTGARVHWNQGSDEDRAVAEVSRRLLAQELTAETAAQIALYNNPELQATYERLGVAQAEVVQAGLLRNPRLSLHYGFALGKTFDELVGAITGPFIDLFLMPLRKRLANAELRRVKLEVADAVLARVAAVKQAFYAVQAATQIRSLRRTIVDASQAATELAWKQHEAGNLSDLDLANQQAAYTQAKLDLARAELQLLGDREKLTRELGVWGLDTEYKVAPELPALPPADPDLSHVERLAIAGRLDLAAAREEVLSASAALQTEKGMRGLGAVDVGLQAHRDPDGPKTIGPTLDLELPIFDQKQAAVARRRAELRAAEARADALALAIRSEVRGARNRLLAARLTIETYARALVPLRERIVALSQEQYNAMLVGVYQLLQAKQNEIESYREYIEAVRDYWMARADLERALGTRLEGDQK